MGLRAQVSDLMELVKDRNKCMNPKIKCPKYPKIKYPKTKYTYNRF
jgi:hypothetical protein